MRFRLVGVAFVLLAWWMSSCGGSKQVTLDPTAPPFEKLSHYHFFTGTMADLHPAENVLLFRPISTLFSDYAQKSRFVWMPPGSAASFNPSQAFDFPVGATLIKNFFYEHASGNRQIIETRLLVNRSQGWDALTYVWNEEQTEAYLEIIGAEKNLRIERKDGASETFQYIIPNKNQCKNCHEHQGKLQPIGPRARNLDFTLSYPDGSSNQLDKWVTMGYLNRREVVPNALVDWSDRSAPLEKRALSYLEINCGTCHQPKGAAYVSGLYLTMDTEDPTQLGVCKGPVSAGKGSGGFKYDIVPGQPDSSILLHRMITQDPGAMMPELGRKLVHEEGVALVRAWIAEMEGGCE